MRRGDLADLNAFLTVADHFGFRAASAQLGVTAWQNVYRDAEVVTRVRCLSGVVFRLGSPDLFPVGFCPIDQPLRWKQ
jgi:hypothetical protein